MLESLVRFGAAGHGGTGPTFRARAIQESRCTPVTRVARSTEVLRFYWNHGCVAHRRDATAPPR